MKDKLTTVKNLAIRHRFKVGVVVGSAATLAYLSQVGKEWHEFLEAEGVYDKYRESLNA